MSNDDGRESREIFSVVSVIGGVSLFLVAIAAGDCLRAALMTAGGLLVVASFGLLIRPVRGD